LKSFNEQAFIAGLTNRDQDARDMKKLYDPTWLKDAELKPVLSALFEYMDTQASTPTLKVLHEYMEDKDKAKYDARWRTTLTQLEHCDEKQQLYAIKRAREAAASYSLHYLIHEQRFQKMVDEGQADPLKAELSGWLAKHTESADEGLFTIQEAFEKLVDDHPWQGKGSKIMTGIKPLDKWTKGGLRAPDFGICMAPTGHGKSAILMNIALHAAWIENQNVLFITNEMPVNQQTERFLARMQDPYGVDSRTGKPLFYTLDEIMDDPGIAYKKLAGYQKRLQEKLVIYSAGLGQTATGIDEVCKRVRNERGVWPDMIVIDYIERMNTDVRMNMEKSWTYFGQIAKELNWLAKRRNAIVWTAIQTNRGGLNNQVDLSMEVAQGSIQHFQESTFSFAVRRRQVQEREDMPPEKCLEFFELKQRHGSMEDRKMIVKTDLSRMYISDIEVTALSKVTDDDDDDVRPQKGKKRPGLKSQANVKGKTK
jgi:replicative DNA helicase